MKLMWQGWPDTASMYRAGTMKDNITHVVAVGNPPMSGEFYVYTPPQFFGVTYVTIRDQQSGWHALCIESEDETETFEKLQTAAKVLLDVVKIRYQEELAKWPPRSNAS